MARLTRYTSSFRGLKALRSSREVDEHLAHRARRIADAANAQYDSGVHAEVVQAGSDTPAPRARVAVIARGAAAMRIEKQRRVLGGSLDAARG